MEKLSFHSLLAGNKYFTPMKKPSFWAVDDISDFHNLPKYRTHYKLVRLVHVKNDEPSLALYYYVNNEMITPNYLFDSGESNDNRISYGRVYNFDRKLARELLNKYQQGAIVLNNMVEPYLLGDALKRDYDIEQALQEDFSNIQQSIEGNSISQQEDDAYDLGVEDIDFIRIHTFNVGQGDTIVIQFSNDRVWIIDAYFRWNSMFTSFQSWLSREVPNFVCDKLILSHLHYDHIKDAIKLMNFAKPKDVVYHGIQTPPTATAVNVLNHAAQNSNLVMLSQTEDLIIGKAIIKLIPTIELAALNTSKDVNTKGIIVTIETPESQVILPGDAHGDQLEELLNNKFIINRDKISYYKVTHHCSSTGNNRAFLNSLNPTNAVTSCGNGNKYKHPSYDPKRKIDQMTMLNDGKHSVTANSSEDYIRWDIS